MEKARFFPSESGLQRKTELRSVHSFHQNAMPFAPCATQSPKETLFCSMRNAGLRKRPFFAPCVTRGAKNHGFSLSSAANSPLNRPPIRRCAFASGRTVYICAPIIKSTDR